MARTRTVKSKEPEVISFGEKLDDLNTEIGKRYGGAMKRASQMLPVSLIHTGSFDIDKATFGGFADHLLNQIKGVQSAGKTTLALQTAKRAQEKYPDLDVVFIDAETHGDPLWIEKNGLDPNRLIIIDDLIYAEAYADVMDGLMKSGTISLIILDSIASLVPNTEVDRSIEDHAKVAALSIVVGKMCSSITTSKQFCAQNGLHFPAIFFLNQYRDKIGGYAPNGIVPKSDNGGRQKDFTATVTLELSNPKKVEYTDAKTGAKRTYIDEQKFKLIKCKSGSYSLSGDIKKVVSSAHPRLKVGQYDESPRVVTFCKKLGMVGGGGQKRWCVVFPDQTFAKESDIALALEADPYSFNLCKAAVVGLLRLEDGRPLTPPDDWLMGFTAKQLKEVIGRIPDVKTVEK